MNEKRIRILFAIPRFSVGGAEKLLVHQLRAIDRGRFAPVLITLFAEQKDSLTNEVRIDRCFGFRSTLDFLRLPSVISYLRKEKFDVVVTHLFSANFLVRIAAVLAGVSTIVSYEHNIYPNKRWWQIFMDKLLSLFTVRIIADSEAARVFTAKQEGIPLEKFVTLYIPPLLEKKESRSEDSVRAELGIPDDHKVVLTVSRLVIDKGHTYLIDAAQKILKDHPNTTFLLVGWGPLEGELREHAKRLGIEDRVLLPGRMDIQEVLPLADVYADPSVSTDLPIAIMEAMREGKAIVATRIGDIARFIEDKKTGLLAEPRDPESLSLKIKILLENAQLAAQFGEEARRRVEGYSLPAYMKSFEELIVNLYESHTH